MKVWKYRLPVPATDDCIVHISMPETARPLSVAVQSEVPTVWALIHPAYESEPKRKARFIVATTGLDVDIPSSAVFIGTFMLQDGALVFHVWWLKEEP